MKKTKKFLTVALAAVMTASIGSASVSADWSYNLSDLDKIVFSVNTEKNYDHNNRSGIGIIIDEDYNINCAYTDTMSSVIIKLAEGIKPEDGMKKISKYQKKIMKPTFPWMNVLYDLDLGIDIDNDDLYYIDTRDMLKEKSTEQYCQELIDNKKAVYAKPIECMHIHEFYPYPLTDQKMEDLVDEGVDSSGFSPEQFVYKLTFANEESAQSFDPNSIANFAENLTISKIKDNSMYFQVKKESEGKTMTNVLCDLKKSEAIKNIGLLHYGIPVDSKSKVLGEIPKDYPLGDTNYDNEISLLDAINIAKHITGSQELDEFQQILADYNEDGKVSLMDAIGIATYILENMKK